MSDIVYCMTLPAATSVVIMLNFTEPFSGTLATLGLASMVGLPLVSKISTVADRAVGNPILALAAMV